ncbi:hypothetical protein MRX96_034209 [Rhipicephalus microplus]
MSNRPKKSKSPARRQEAKTTGKQQPRKSPESVAPAAPRAKEQRRSPFKGSLHAAKVKAARNSGRIKMPTSSVALTAHPDEVLAAVCQERMSKKPGFAALVGPVIPSAAASAPACNGDASTDFLISLDEDVI